MYLQSEEPQYVAYSLSVNALVSCMACASDLLSGIAFSQMFVVTSSLMSAKCAR